MTQEDKELLLKNLSARLPYDIMVLEDIDKEFDGGCIAELVTITEIKGEKMFLTRNSLTPVTIEEIRPYLRPMSSMTEEEMDKIEKILGDKCIFDFMGNGDVSLHQGNFTQNMLSKLYDFYNSIHVDYRGLIEKGLALKAPEDMYKHFGDMDVVVTSIEHKDKL